MAAFDRDAFDTDAFDVDAFDLGADATSHFVKEAASQPLATLPQQDGGRSRLKGQKT